MHPSQGYNIEEFLFFTWLKSEFRANDVHDNKTALARALG